MIVDLTAEAWRDTKERNPWDDDDAISVEDLEAVHITVTVVTDTISYLIQSHRPNRTMIAFKNGDTITVIGDQPVIRDACFPPAGRTARGV